MTTGTTLGVLGFMALLLTSCLPSSQRCECALPNGVTLACGAVVCLDGQGFSCADKQTVLLASACTGPTADRDAGVAVLPDGGLVMADCRFPLVVQSALSATFEPPTPGRCARGLVITCSPTATPGAGVQTMTPCAADEECLEYEMQVFFATSATAPFEQLGSYDWARCVPRTASSIAYTFDAGVWSTTEAARCMGSDRLHPANLAQLAGAHAPTIMREGAGPPLTSIVHAGSPDGILQQLPCPGTQACATSGTRVVCTGSMVSCTRSRCDGTLLTTCRNGFEEPPVDCAATGQSCFTPQQPSNVCAPGVDLNGNEMSASCQAPGTISCAASTGDSCLADKTGYRYCETFSCGERIARCRPSQTCVHGSCLETANLCDVAAEPSSCSGSSVTWCQNGGLRRTADCASFGMTCTTVADANKPGGMRSGCIAVSTIDPCVSPPGQCVGTTALKCCSAQGEFVESGLPFGSIACIPGRAAQELCTTCAFDSQRGPYCH